MIEDFWQYDPATRDVGTYTTPSSSETASEVTLEMLMMQARLMPALPEPDPDHCKVCDCLLDDSTRHPVHVGGPPGRVDVMLSMAVACYLCPDCFRELRTLLGV